MSTNQTILLQNALPDPFAVEQEINICDKRLFNNYF